MAKFRFMFLAALASSSVLAASLTYDLTTLPVTKFTDGTTITVPVTYNFYAGDCVATPTTVIKTGSTTLAFSYAQPDGAPKTCIYSTAVVDGVESALSPNPYTIAARPIVKKTPMAPAGVTKQ